jgi:hypothetical protein
MTLPPFQGQCPHRCLPFDVKDVSTLGLQAREEISHLEAADATQLLGTLLAPLLLQLHEAAFQICEVGSECAIMDYLGVHCDIVQLRNLLIDHGTSLVTLAQDLQVLQDVDRLSAEDVLQSSMERLGKDKVRVFSQADD